MSYIGATKIGKIYLGSTEISKAYLGTNLVFQKGGSGYNRLPDGYTELMYVTTDSNAWIDTGVSGATDLEIYTRFYAGNYTQYASVYSNYLDGDHEGNRVLLYSSTSLSISGGNNLSQIINGFSIGAVYDLTVNSTTAILNGVSTAIAAQTLTANTSNICLGNRNVSDPMERDAALRIYSFNIKKNGTSVLRYIPARRNSDDAVGFYDLVSETFVKSLTGTEFVAGPVATVPYIRNYNGAYIDTGITADNTVKVVIWARNYNPHGGQFFGSRVSTSEAIYSVYTGPSTNEGTIRACYGSVNVNNANDQFTKLSHYHKYEFYDGVLKVDGTTVVSAEKETFSNNYNIHLFGINNGGIHSDMSLPVDVCACKIYKNGALVRNFTPVEYPSVGFYDSVSDTVFTNAGSGCLVYSTFNTGLYTPLEYVHTSGSSHFLTPLIGTYSVPIVVKFRPTSSTASWFDVVGGRNSTDRCQIFTGNDTISNARLYAILGTASAPTLYSTNTTGALKNVNLIVVKSNNIFTAYKDNSIFGTSATCSVNSSYSTGVPLGIGATWNATSQNWTPNFVGRIYYVGFDKYNYVPAKVDGVAGMYDTYNDTFYPSTSSTPFTAGTIVR